MPKAVKIAKEFSVRVDKHELELVNELIETSGKSMNDVVRKAIRLLGGIQRDETTLRTKDGTEIPKSVIFS